MPWLFEEKCCAASVAQQPAKSDLPCESSKQTNEAKLAIWPNPKSAGMALRKIRFTSMYLQQST